MVHNTTHLKKTPYSSIYSFALVGMEHYQWFGIKAGIIYRSSILYLTYGKIFRCLPLCHLFLPFAAYSRFIKSRQQASVLDRYYVDSLAMLEWVQTLRYLLPVGHNTLRVTIERTKVGWFSLQKIVRNERFHLVLSVRSHLSQVEMHPVDKHHELPTTLIKYL